jgi:YD repeat-containing protein
MTTTKQYDYLNRLTSISSTLSAAGQPPLSCAYGYNTANQRTTLTDGDGPHWSFGYDSLGQVISGSKYWGDNTPVPGEQFDYNFDNIGNRVYTLSGGNSSGANLRSNSYAVNDLNQYTSRTVTNGLDILGIANYQASVTVNGASYDYRWGEFYQKGLTITNSSGPVWLTVTNTATYSVSSSNVVGRLFMPQSPEVFSNDLDGNLVLDGRFSYSWDAENRLTNITSLSGAPTGSLVKLDPTYDYRFIWKVCAFHREGGMTVGHGREVVARDFRCVQELPFHPDGG